MVKLDYRTTNPRWGKRGIIFSSWKDYAFILGYLANPSHNRELFKGSSSANISMRVERNDEQGAWDKEGRIHFYGGASLLNEVLPDLYRARSAGVGQTTFRIDSNEYILSLINDYKFSLQQRDGCTTADVFPPAKDEVNLLLQEHLAGIKLSDEIILECLQSFGNGYSYNN